MASYLVTGSSRGIGLELVRQLLTLPSSEVSVIFAVTRSSSSPQLDALTKGSSDANRIVSIAIANHANVEEVSKAVKDVESHLEKKRLKGLDVLVNVAGVMPFTGGNGKPEDLEVSDMMSTFEANVVGPQVITSQFLPLLKKGNLKKIMNVSTTLGSIAKVKYYSWAPAYSYKITKAAMNMWSQQYALSLENEGFCVALITPGWLKTDLGSDKADLDVDVGVKAVMDIILKTGPADNGKFLNIHVPGWEHAEGPNQYDGLEVPW